MSCNSSTYTIAEHLRGLSPLINEDGLRSILARRGFDGDTPYSELTQRDVDLLEGFSYFWLSNLPVGGSSVKDADGDWSHSEGGWQISKTDKDRWFRLYKSLYAKWGEEPVPVVSGVRLVNFPSL